MQGYNDPIVTYDEIVDALKSIVECSLNGNYIDDFNYLNVKYEAGTKTKVNYTEEKALYHAIKSLERSIDSSSKIIRSGLERELIDYEKSIIKINCDYVIGQEKRRLSAGQQFVRKIKDKSLKIDVLYHAPQYEEQEDIVALDSLKNIDTNKIFSEFEKNAIINFPDFFKEELAIANEEEIEHHDLFDNMEFELSNSDDMAELEEIEPKKKDRTHLIRVALKKARELDNQYLIEKLEKQLDDELNSQ